jgi:hypothetical protein
MHLETACELAGIDYSTFRRWMQKGAESHPASSPKREFSDFCEDVTRAIAKSEAALLGKIQSSPDWRAQGWILERRFPERWANSHRVQILLQREMEAILDQLERTMPKQEYASLFYYISALEQTVIIENGAKR